MSETSISLFDCFSWVPDPRSSWGKRHPLGEDACQVRKRSVFCTLRNGVLNVLQTLGVKNRAAQLRTFCAIPSRPLMPLAEKQVKTERPCRRRRVNCIHARDFLHSHSFGESNPWRRHGHAGADYLLKGPTYAADDHQADV
jgi:hypothetical protein